MISFKNPFLAKENEYSPSPLFDCPESKFYFVRLDSQLLNHREIQGIDIIDLRRILQT